jgi:hypothetical protein
MKEPAESLILRRAAGLVQQGWCQRAEARKRDGSACACIHPEAVRFCLLGSVWKAQLEYIRQHGGDNCLCWVASNLQWYAKDLAGKRPGSWNDHPKRTKQQVIDALLRAAAKARANT